MPEQSHDERAAALRVKFRSETRESFAAQFGGDLSESGIFLKTQKPLALGTLLRMQLLLRDGTPVIVGAGRVVFRRAAGGVRPGGMGVQFLKLDADSRALVASIVAARDGAPSHYDDRKDAELAPALAAPRAPRSQPAAQPGSPFGSPSAAPVTTAPRAPRRSPGTIPGVFSDTSVTAAPTTPPEPAAASPSVSAPPASSSISGTFFPDEAVRTASPGGSPSTRAQATAPPARVRRSERAGPPRRPTQSSVPHRSPSVRSPESARPRSSASLAASLPAPPRLPSLDSDLRAPSEVDDTGVRREAELAEATGFLASTFSSGHVGSDTAEAVRRIPTRRDPNLAHLFDDLDLEDSTPAPAARGDALSQSSPLPLPPSERPPSERPAPVAGDPRTSIPPGFDVDAPELQELSALEPDSDPPPALASAPPGAGPVSQAPPQAPSLPEGDLSARGSRGGQLAFLGLLLFLGLLAFVIAYAVARGRLPTDLLPPAVTSAIAPAAQQEPAAATDVVTVDVSAEPVGAALIVDGDDRGQGPLMLSLTPGTPTTVVARLAGYADTERILHADDAQQPVKLTLVPRTFVIEVDSVPPGADARALGIAGETPCRLDLGFIDGPVKLLVRKSGQRTVARELVPDDFALDGEALVAKVSVDLTRRSSARPHPQAVSPELPSAAVPAEVEDTTPPAASAAQVLSLRPVDDGEEAAEPGSAEPPAPPSPPEP